MPRKFYVTLKVDVTLLLNEDVIDIVDDGWRSAFYDLHTPKDIASHIAYNMVANEIELSQMDGWADMSNGNAVLFSQEWEVDDCQEAKK